MDRKKETTQLDPIDVACQACPMRNERDDASPAGDHTDDEPQILVGISFEDLFRAQEFLTAATRLAANGSLRLRDAVMVVKDEHGKTVVRETTDPQPGRAALGGAMWAGLFGLLLGGPVGLLAGTALGAGAGAVTAHVVDIGISDEWVAWFREAVQPDTATVALLVTQLDRDALVAEARRFTGAHLVYANLEQSTLDQISEGLGEPRPPTSDAEVSDLSQTSAGSQPEGDRGTPGS
ncbi:MAG: DUF1269 domain-containing protein [Actinomycetota bacterium]|nr:DUF1269 domain-containing protein [Actinomycetota bacterium]